MNRAGIFKILFMITIISGLLLSSCAGTSSVTTTMTSTTTVTTTGTTPPTTTTTPPVYTVTELKYILLAYYPEYFWCDPDLYPIARQGEEQQNSIAQFPAIQANQEEFTAILEHLNLQGQTSFTDEQKLLIYREYKKLTYVIDFKGPASPQAGTPYNYAISVQEDQGYRISGNISIYGKITETSITASFNT